MRSRFPVMLWAVAAALISVVIITPAGASSKDAEVVAKLSVRPPAGANLSSAGGSLIVNPIARMGFQPYLTDTAESVVRLIDLDSLKEVGLVRIPYPLAAPVQRTFVAEFVHTVDYENNRLFLGYNDLARPQDATTFTGIAVVNGNTKRLEATFSRTDSIDPTDSVGCTAASCLPQVPGATPKLWGMDFVPSHAAGGRPKLIMLWQEQPAPGLESSYAIVHVAEWDPETGHQNWVYQVRACTNRVLPSNAASHYASAIMHARVGTGIYFACNASGGTTQVVRLTLDSSGRPSSESAFPGPSSVSDTFADPESDRIILRIDNEEGESLWVFDGISNSYTGVIGVLPAQLPTAMGLDQDTGRFYILAPAVGDGSDVPGGLLMSDIRRSPAPQTTAVEEFAASGLLRIAVDGRAQGGTRRVFLRMNDDPYYTVVQDNLPVTEDAPLTDLDRFTVDVPESKDTGVNFTGTGHAWGLRASFIGGVDGAIQGGPEAGSIRLGRAIPPWIGSPCGPSSRRLSVGEVQSAGLSNNLASAAATAGSPDPGTGTDVREPTARCYGRPRPGGVDVGGLVFGEDYPKPIDTDTDGDGLSDLDEYAGSDWPFGTAECGSDSTGTTGAKVRPGDRGGPVSLPDEVRETDLVPQDVDETARLDGPPGGLDETTTDLPGFQATAVCKQSKGNVTANATADVFEQQEIPDVGRIQVASVASDVSIRKSKGLLVSRSTAVARGINIADRIFIDAAITIAEARAGGRPGTAETDFYRRLCGVKIPDLNIDIDAVDLDLPYQDTPAGGVDPLNEDTDDVAMKDLDVDTCGDPRVAPAGSQPVVDAMNTALGSRGRVTIPEPDGELRKGTSGGYLASIQKDRLEAISARAVNNDESTQVPALQILILNDDPNAGRGRQIYQFAGVDASVTYGIFLLNPGESFETVPDILIDLTGGVPFQPPVDPVAPGVPQGPPAKRGPFTILFQGIGFLFRSPADALLAAAVWMLLFAPVQLSARRRALRGLA